MTELEGADVSADLVAFLRERVAEDRRIAVAAHQDSPAPWEFDTQWDFLSDANNVQVVAAEDTGTGVVPGEAGPHIARWDPARVLAECDAKERIIEQCDRRVPGGAVRWLDVATSRDVMIMQALALPYSGHPDYREEWKP